MDFGNKYMLKDFVDKTLCVLVLYKTNLIDSNSFSSILKVLKTNNITLEFLIYDNSPEAFYNENDEKYENTIINYFHNQQNEGVSKAYNAGFQMAMLKNKKWLLLMDQDTICQDNFFEEYLNSINEYPSVSLFVPKLMFDKKILSPCNFYFGRGSAMDKINIGIHNFKWKSLLNSGMLIKAEAFERTGGYNDKIKLDFSDFFFIDKFKEKYKSFVVTNAICLHELSSSEQQLESIIVRFKLYCEGAKYYAKTSNFILVLIWSKLRMLKLFVKYRDIRFLKIFYKTFFNI
ncbi:MAG: glycosyltransferase [Bacteroidetes bacterium]|nr:glycosyltransferase [Bacteroidota bacterium]